LISNKELLNDWIRRNSRLDEAEAGEHGSRDNEVLSRKSLIHGSTDAHGTSFAYPASQLRERDVHHINEEVCSTNFNVISTVELRIKDQQRKRSRPYQSPL